MSNLLVLILRTCIHHYRNKMHYYKKKNRIYSNKFDNKFVTSIGKSALIELAILSLEFTIDQKYYNQVRGFFTGAPIMFCRNLYLKGGRMPYLQNVKSSSSMVQKI